MLGLDMRRSATALLAGLVALGAVAATGASAATERLVRLNAVLSPGGEEVYDGMDIGIWRLEDGEVVGHVDERHAAPAEIKLAPGQYRIEAIYGEVRRVTDITVPADGSAEQTINLNAGRVQLQLLKRANGPAVTQDVTWEVRRYRRGSDEGRKVADARGDRPDLWLGEGWYEVRARHAGQQVQHVVEVNAGRTYDYAIVLDK